MSDLHFFENTFNGTNGSGSVKVAFHVPNDKVKNKFPGGVTSVVPGLDQAEIDGLNDGTLYEEVLWLKDNVRKTDGDGAGFPGVKKRAQRRWASVASKVQARLDRTHGAYLDTADRIGE